MQQKEKYKLQSRLRGGIRNQYEYAITQSQIYDALPHMTTTPTTISNEIDKSKQSSFELISLIEKIGKYYSTKNILHKLDFDCWRYIITSNFLYPHEIYGTILLINKHFNQLFDKKWLINKLTNKTALEKYYRGLIQHCKCVCINDDDRYDQIYFATSMILIIERLSNVKDKLDLMNKKDQCLCCCNKWQDWSHYRCNGKLNENKNKIENESNFGGIIIDCRTKFPVLKFLHCCCDSSMDRESYVSIVLRFLENEYFLLCSD